MNVGLSFFLLSNTITPSRGEFYYCSCKIETKLTVISTGRLVLKKVVFSALASKLNTGLINKG